MSIICMCQTFTFKMKAPLIWGFIFGTLITVSNSVPASPATYQHGTRLAGSDEIRITASNRDVCLAKLLCGMSVVSIQDAHDSSGSKDGEIYGDYAQIVGNFFVENPADEEDADDEGSMSQESVEALEDYSVSNEADDDEIEEPTHNRFHHHRPKRPEAKKKAHKQKRKPYIQTTPQPITIKVPTKKPTPPGIQIFGLGMPVQEGSKSSPKTSESLSIFQSPKINSRMARARKIWKQAGLATKLRTVRQCQKISGCTYSFKQLYQKYGGKGVIDEVSQPNIPLPVVEEKTSRPLPPFDPKITTIPEEGDQGPFDNPWVSPPETASPATSAFTPLDDNYEYGSMMGGKIPPALQSYFQSSSSAVHSADFSNPGTAYKIKKGNNTPPKPPSRIPIFKKKKKKTTTTTEATTTTTTTTTEPTTTTTTTEPTTTTTTSTPPPRRIVHYKRPPNKKKPQNGDDDEDDNINVTGPVQLIGHDEHDFDDEVVDKKQHHIEYEDEQHSSNESVDDYDEEAKYNTPVDYGNDEESDEEQDDDDDEDDEEEGIRPIKTKTRPKPTPKPVKIIRVKNRKPAVYKTKKPAQHQYAQDEVTSSQQHQNRRPVKHKPEKGFDLITHHFQGVESGKLKQIKKKQQHGEERPGHGPKEQGSSEEADEDDFDDNDKPPPPPFTYPSHIGGRPIFPDYDVPVTAYGMTRSTMPVKPRPHPYSPSDSGAYYGNKKTSNNPQYIYHNGPSIQHPQSSGEEGPSYEPSMSSGMSVLSPIKSLFKHLSSGISPNPVGGSMGYTQGSSHIHYTMPPGAPGPGGNSQYPPGIVVPQKDDDESPEVPQIAIMPKIPVGPESSNYRRFEKYTINKSKKIPSL